MRTVLPVFFLTLAACDDVTMEKSVDAPCAPGFAESGDACAFDEASVVEVMRDFEGAGLVKVNRMPFTQVMGPKLERNVWVSPLPVGGTGMTAADLYALIRPDVNAPLPAAFPVGTLIVHETIDRSEGHTVQVKLGPDYDDGLGRPWWTGKYYDDGEPDLADCTPCTTCHNAASRPDTEGLYGVPGDVL